MEAVSPILDYAEPPRRHALLRTAASPWLLLPLILLAAFSLRWFQLDHESLWLDEFLAMQNSTGRGPAHMSFERDVLIDPPPPLTRLSDGPGFWWIWTSLATDSHPPLYFLILNVWRHVFGEGDLAARGLSVAFSLVAIVLLYDVARLLHGPTVGLWAALLMALAGVQIQYAQEARNYTMVLALMLGACDALVRIGQRGAGAWREFALGGCLLAMLLTHYLSLPAILAIALYAVIRLRGRALRLTLATFVIVGALFAAVWGPFLLQQTTGFSREISAAVEGSEGNLVRAIKRLAILPLRYFTEPMKGSMSIGQISAVMYVLPLLLLPRRRDLLLWVLLGGFVIVWVVATDLLRSAHGLAYVRYTFLASAPAYALAAAMLWHMKGAFAHLVSLVLSISCIVAIAQPYSLGKADTRELAQFVRSRCDAEDILLVHTLSGHDWQARALYLGLSHYSIPPCPVVFVSEHPPAEIERRVRLAREVWIMSPSPAIPIDAIFPGSEMVEASFFPWVGTVERIRLPGAK